MRSVTNGAPIGEPKPVAMSQPGRRRDGVFQDPDGLGMVAAGANWAPESKCLCPGPGDTMHSLDARWLWKWLINLNADPIPGDRQR
jgi:hypothetical protein